MTTVVAENRNTLRPAIQVYCGFDETNETPSPLYNGSYGALTMYMPLANAYQTSYPTTRLMDLSGDGFLNDGFAEPIHTNLDNGYRYGFISATVAQADGSFVSAFGANIQANSQWDYVTLELMDHDGNTTTEVYEPVWNGTTTTVTIDNWTYNKRCYITGVHLGKSWYWEPGNLLSVNLDLRSVGTEMGGELEVSSIEIQAYETNDYIDVIGRIPQGAPIWYYAGYDEDYSTKRVFYKSEPVTWENNVLTVKGQDASMFLENEETAASYISTTYAQVPTQIVKRVKDALDGTVTYTETGTAPVGAGSTSTDLFFDNQAPRTIISELTGLFRDSDHLRITYVDAGIPTLYIGDSNNRNWTIYADEIADLSFDIEANINTIEGNIKTVSVASSKSSTQCEAKAGGSYFVELDSPYVPNSITVSPTPTSYSVLSPTTVKIVAAATTTYTISGYAITTTVSSSDDPYSVTNGEKGITYSFEDETLSFTNEDGSLTKLAMAYILDRSNILYTFNYRGNPHIQPRDTLNVQIAKWGNVQSLVNGLYPANDLYPDSDVYPDATYKTKWTITKEWVTMTVDSVTLDHNDGGLVSQIVARKGVV